MKINITLLVLMLGVNAVAQDWLPPFPALTDKTPKWTYLSVDSNFVKNDFDPFSSKYSHRITEGLQEVDGSVLWLESTLTQSPYLGPDGFLLHKIDIMTGEVDYILHNNIYVGNFERESYSYKDYIIDENRLELYGIQSENAIDTSSTFPDFYARGPIIKRVIDIDDGSYISQQVGPIEDEYRLAYSDGVGNTFLTNSEGDQMRTEIEVSYVEDSLYSFINVFLLNEDLSLDTTPIYRAAYYSGLDNFPPPQLTYPFRHFPAGDNHFAALFGQTDLDNGLIPKRSTLQIFDVSESDDIYMSHEIEMLDEFYFPQSPGSFNVTMYPLDDYVMVYQQFTPLDLGGNVYDAFWCNIYDTNGQLKWRVPFGNFQEQYYYEFMTPLGSRGDDFYFAGRRRYATLETAVDQYDIVRVSTGSQTLERLGVIDWTLDREEEFYSVFFGLITENDDLLLHLRTQFLHPDSEEETNAQWLALFDGMDVGLKPSSTDDQMSQSIQVYPNPTADYVNIDRVVLGDASYRLIDNRGVLVLTGDLDPTTTTLDLSQEVPGTYYLTVSSGDYAVTRPIIVIK